MGNATREAFDEIVDAIDTAEDDVNRDERIYEAVDDAIETARVKAEADVQLRIETAVNAALAKQAQDIMREQARTVVVHTVIQASPTISIGVAKRNRIGDALNAMYSQFERPHHQARFDVEGI